MIPRISTEVLHFLADNIDTVPQLETLLLVWQHPHRSWTIGDVAARLYIQSNTAAATLDALEKRRLVLRNGDPWQYRFDGRWDPQGTVMTAVAREYSRNLVIITKLIHSGTPSAIQEFARAFEIKKPE